jgi:hypothetical protein
MWKLFSSILSLITRSSLWMSDTVSKCPFSFIFNLGNNAKSLGVSPANRENDNHVVASYKLCGFQGHVGGRVIMIKEQCGACSNFLLSPGKLHNWSLQWLLPRGLFCDRLCGRVLKIFQHFLFFFFAGAELPRTFVVFKWHLTGLEQECH